MLSCARSPRGINAGIQSELGYDFGYCSPGEIRLINSSGWEYDGM